ncbi:uridine kinase [Bacillus cereus]|uniref:uridine kinase n=1 Tax=Bacillus cereus TaxID=1396 RepID=UPI003980B0EA
MEYKGYKNLKEIEENILEGYADTSKASKHFLVGVSGIDASGKSTFASHLRENLLKKDIPCLIISGDDFFFKRKVRYANPDGVIGYYKESCDYKKLFELLLLPLKQSCNVFHRNLQIVDWKTDKYIQIEYALEKPTVVIVEGVFLFKKEHLEVFDYKIWMALSFRQGVKRAMKRERDILHYGSKQKVKERYLNRLYRAQLLHLKIDEPYSRCHAITNSSLKGDVVYD